LEPNWLSRRFLDEAHQDQLREHGGLSGVRDENALESALARPKNRWAYQPGVTLCQLAAAYGYGLATSHPYSDGNKRVALAAVYTFLGLNGLELSAGQMEVVDVILSLADGSLHEDAFAAWLEKNTVPFED